MREARYTWHTVRGGLINPGNADGKFLSRLWSALASREIDVKSKRQLAANEARRRRGEPMLGGRPFGFELDRVHHREVEADEIKWAYQQLLAGRTIYSIVTNWNRRGITTTMGGPWSYMGVQQVLKRPRNAGRDPRWRGLGGRQGGLPEPIVPREPLEAALQHLGRPRQEDHPVSGNLAGWLQGSRGVRCVVQSCALVAGPTARLGSPSTDVRCAAPRSKRVSVIRRCRPICSTLSSLPRSSTPS